MNLFDFLPYDLKVKIGNDAVDKCKYLIPLFFNSMGNAEKGVYFVIKEDGVRLKIAEGYEYVYYQNQGFETFVMKELKGKVIPMMINGRRVFRFASRINQFNGKRAKYIRRDSGGELYVHDEPRRRWVHPGLMPKNFMQEALKISYEMNRGEIENEFYKRFTLQRAK